MITTRRHLVGVDADVGIAADHRIGQQMHKAANTISAMATFSGSGAPPSSSRPSRASRAGARAGEPDQCSRLAHAAATGSATSVRNVSSRLVLPLPVRVQLVQRAFGDQPPVGDDADAVGHALGDFENMRGHDDGAAGAQRARAARS